MPRYVSNGRSPGPVMFDTSMHWSPDHARLLAYCAHRTNGCLVAHGLRALPIEDLMQEGWWRCLRRLPPERLRYGIGNTISAMLRWAVRWQAHGRMVCSINWPAKSLPDADGALVDRVIGLVDRHDDRAPIDARDLCRQLQPHIKPRLWQIGWRVLAQGERQADVARQMRITKERVRQLLEQFRQQAQRALQRMKAGTE